MASVQNVGPHLWVLAEKAIGGHHLGKSPLMDGLRTALGEVLAEAGHVLLEIAPVSALQFISWHAEANADLGADGDGIDVAA